MSTELMFSVVLTDDDDDGDGAAGVLYLQVFGDGVMSSVCDDEDGVSAADQRVSGLDPAGVPVCDARSHDGHTQLSVIGLIELPEREQSQTLVSQSLELRCFTVRAGFTSYRDIHYIAKSIGTPSNEQVWLL